MALKCCLDGWFGAHGCLDPARLKGPWLWFPRAVGTIFVPRDVRLDPKVGPRLGFLVFIVSVYPFSEDGLPLPLQGIRVQPKAPRQFQEHSFRFELCGYWVPTWRLMRLRETMVTLPILVVTHVMPLRHMITDCLHSQHGPTILHIDCSSCGGFQKPGALIKPKKQRSHFKRRPQTGRPICRKR